MDWQVLSLSFEYRITNKIYSTGVAEVDRHSSWWPQFHQWEDSGLDVGYWGSYCETWYQNRLNKLLSGELTVRGGREWKVALKMEKLTGKLVKNNETMSMAFLQSLL